VSRSRAAVAALVAAIAGCSHTQPAEQPTSDAPTVVVVSFDALGDRFLDRDTLPNFRRMIAEGVRAPFRPEFPSKTFPNHYSMATGLTPGQHGLVLNQFFDPARNASFLRASAADGSWFGGEPIWVTAGKAGIRTAAYFWMGSEAEILGRRPSYWHQFDASVPDSTKIIEIMHWLRLPTNERPRLIMTYSPVVDIPGHPYGPDAPQTLAGVRAADRTLGVLRDSLAALRPRPIDLIIVSDHGLEPVSRGDTCRCRRASPRAVARRCRRRGCPRAPPPCAASAQESSGPLRRRHRSRQHRRR